MILKELEPDQIETLYKQRMIIDFPKDELKPLKMILEARGRGIYECLGVFEDDELIGYSFFEKAEGNYLLDYLAVFPEKRNGGIGSRVLGLLETSIRQVARLFPARMQLQLQTVSLRLQSNLRALLSPSGTEVFQAEPYTSCRMKKSLTQERA